ncbi:MAG: YqgE/AlgH family protein [Thermoleophilia bacterium]|nr:YqgE/AlgH family protein [Thermoleophilia bacterium]
MASPALVDPNFRRAVVLMLEHNEDGALGVVLNRPGDLVAREALPPPLGPVMPEGEAIFEGGPVQPETVIVLADFADPGAAGGLAFAGVGIVDPSGDLESLAGRVRAIRAFGGYAGWAAGQLEGEIAQEAWIDAEPRADDVFTDHPEGLWPAVLERKGGQFRFIARMPEDPSLN